MLKRYLHYSNLENLESIRKYGLKKGNSLVYAFEDDKYGMLNILDMITWRSFGVDFTDSYNTKYAAFNSCLAVFEVNEEDVQEKDDNGIVRFDRDIKPEEIIEVREILSKNEKDNLERILLNFQKGNIYETDINEMLNINIMIRNIYYPHLTDTEYILEVNKVNPENKQQYLRDLANEILNDYKKQGYLLNI